MQSTRSTSPLAPRTPAVAGHAARVIVLVLVTMATLLAPVSGDDDACSLSLTVARATKLVDPYLLGGGADGQVQVKNGAGQVVCKTRTINNVSGPTLTARCTASAPYEAYRSVPLPAAPRRAPDSQQASAAPRRHRERGSSVFGCPRF